METDKITSGLDETNAEFWKIKLFEVILEAVIVFFFVATIVQFLEVSILYVFLVSFIYSVARIVYLSHRMNITGQIVSRYPKLDERLQTAYDNRDKSNLIVDDLVKDVSKDMDTMESSAFMSNKAITTRITVAIALMFLFLSINLLFFDRFLDTLDSNFLPRLQDYGSDSWDRLKDIGLDDGHVWESSENYSNPKEEEKLGGESGGEMPGVSEGPIPGRGGGIGMESDQNIFGEKSSAGIYGEDIDMEIHPEYGGEITIRDVTEEAKKSEFSIDDVEGSSEYEDASVKHHELVKRYFEKLLEESK